MMLGGGWAEWKLYWRIRQQAASDEAQPADAIVVLGAAQYNGSPSPVLRARLDHAFDLEVKGLAHLVITCGGRGGDAHFTEGGVGRDYLVQAGIAEDEVTAEGHGETTYASVRAVSELLHARHKSTCIAVSDGFHLYRVKLMFKAQGIQAYGSPDPESPIETSSFERFLYSLREALSVNLWYLGFKG